MKHDVLLFGDYFFDLIFSNPPRLPQLGDEVYAAGFDHAIGGAFICAAAMRRLELRVAWAADFGNDLFSRSALEAARRERLDEALFRHHDRPYRRLTVAASFPGDRAFLSYTDPPPRVSAAVRALAQPALTAEVLVVPGLVPGPLFELGRRVARGRGMKIVMDCQATERTLSEPVLRRAVAGVDVFMPNSLEARRLTGTPNTLEALQALGRMCPLVVIKDGPDGAHAIRGGQTYYAPALPVKVLDTTGAGDAFNAGFVRAWLDDRPLEECLRWGNICGGLSTRARGGATVAPTLAEAQRLVAAAKG